MPFVFCIYREIILPDPEAARYRRAQLKNVAFSDCVRSPILYVAVGRRCVGRILSITFAMRNTPTSSKR